MLWRVGRGSRQSLHQFLHSLADSFIPSSPRPYPTLSLTCLRSFTLSRRRVRPVPKPRDYDDLNTSGSFHQRSVRLDEHPSPIHVPLLEQLSTMGPSHPRPATTHSPGKQVLNIWTNPEWLRAFSDSCKVSKLARQLASTPRPRTALLVLVAAHRYGYRLRKEVYEAVAWHFAKAQQWRLIPALARLQKRQLGRHTPRLLDWYIRALVETSHFARLDRALGWFEEGGLTPSQRTYLLLLSGHLRNRNIAKAMDVIQQMSKAGFTTDPYTQATVISAYRTLGPDVVVQTRAFNALKDADAKTSTRILNALLQFSIDAHDTERVISLVRHFDFGMFDVSRLSRGVDLLRREGEDAIFSNLIRASNPGHAFRRKLPDIATYTILLHYLASKGDLVSAHGLLGQMKRSDITPDSRFIAALVRLYFATGRPRAAIDVVSALCADVDRFKAVFENIRLAPEPREEFSLRRVPPKPTVEILNALADGLLHLCGINGLRACIRLMQMCRVNPDHHTKALLEYHLNSEGFATTDVSWVSMDTVLNDFSLSRLSRFLALSLRRQFRNVQRSGWNNTSPKRQSSFQTRSPPHLAQISTVGKSFGPNAGLFPTLTHQITRIWPTIQSLADRGVLADRRISALRIQYEAVINGDMGMAKNVFQIMLDRGLHPNEYHYAALMEGYVASGDSAAAEAVMDSAERGGIKPNCVMHTILIVGYARQNNPEQAIRVLRHMIATGVRPDVPAIDAITSVFFAVGAYRLARQTLITLWPSVAPLPHKFERASLKMLVFHLRNLHRGRSSSKELSDGERRDLRAKLRKLFKAWFAKERLRMDWQQEALMYVKKPRGTLQRESSQSQSP